MQYNNFAVDPAMAHGVNKVPSTLEVQPLPLSIFSDFTQAGKIPYAFPHPAYSYTKFPFLSPFLKNVFKYQCMATDTLFPWS